MVTKFIQNPTLPTFESWIAQLNIDLPNYNIPKDYTVDQWWNWANFFILNNNLQDIIPLPTKSSYPKEEDWKKWVLSVISLNSIVAIA